MKTLNEKSRRITTATLHSKTRSVTLTESKNGLVINVAPGVSRKVVNVTIPRNGSCDVSFEKNGNIATVRSTGQVGIAYALFVAKQKPGRELWQITEEDIIDSTFGQIWDIDTVGSCQGDDYIHVAYKYTKSQ